jgi:H+/Cl- antiporter ClcA
MTGLLFNADSSLPWHTFPSRFMGTIITYISGGAGGVFAPSLAIGASLGDAIVSIFSIPEFKNLIIIVCMIGFMSGVTHAPFTSFILVLEMTDRHTAVFPMMLAAVIALAVSRSFDRKSLYEHLTENYVNAPDIEGSKKIEADVK